MLARELKPSALTSLHTDPSAMNATSRRIREHYLIECDLAKRLRDAPQEQRRHLYSNLYDELYRRVPDHPQLVHKLSATESNRRTQEQMKFLERYVKPDSVFLEVGPGDCALSFHMAQRVRAVHGVDVSDAITKCRQPPANFKLAISDGTSIPVEPQSVDLVYSNQLMEHLHPDDAIEQLRNIYATLKAEGRYVCITPNRLTGPHDVSRYFDREPRGFHLKEYSTSELISLFKEVGFRRLQVAIGGKGMFWQVPASLVTPLERVLDVLPFTLRRTIARRLHSLLGVRLIAVR
jgi:SAM-dependent methyltransferase